MKVNLSKVDQLKGNFEEIRKGLRKRKESKRISKEDRKIYKDDKVGMDLINDLEFKKCTVLTYVVFWTSGTSTRYFCKSY